MVIPHIRATELWTHGAHQPASSTTIMVSIHFPEPTSDGFRTSRMLPAMSPRSDHPLRPGYVPPIPSPLELRPPERQFEYSPSAPDLPADHTTDQPTTRNVHPSMQWATLSQMPEELRNLLPFPILPPPTVPDFAERPEFGFLSMQEAPQLPTPPTLREPQLSQLEGQNRSDIEDFHFVQQHVAYSRQHRRDRPNNRPAVQLHSQLDRQHRPQLFEFHRTQQQVERARTSRKERARRTPANVEEAEYDGSTDTCPLCRDRFEPGESALRLACRHIYHVECWTEHMCHSEQLSCPVRRGGCHIVARYRVPDGMEAAQVQQELSRPVTPDRQTNRATDAFNIFTPPGRAPRVNSESPEAGTPFFSPENPAQTFPWWPSDSVEATAAYHSISLPDRAGIIIDPGAYANLIGENTARMFAKVAIENGHKPRQWKMKPMYVQGVGEGQQKCEWTVSIPIACKLSIGGKQVCLNYFEAPVVGGSGARLPALLGLRSLTSLSATLCMHENNEALYVPLPGGSIEDLHQCRKCPLAKAPSGRTST